MVGEKANRVEGKLDNDKNIMERQREGGGKRDMGEQ